MQNPYLQLTDQFHRGRLRAIVGAGPAVVLHRLAVMSKDGDWIRTGVAATADHLPLAEAHAHVVTRALGVLPFTVEGAP